MAVSFNKWFVLAVFPSIFLTVTGPVRHDWVENDPKQPVHPFHVSVTEVNHNARDKTLEISCKIFTDDFEEALSKKFQVKVDLINPKDRPAMDKLVSEYIHGHLQVKADNKAVTVNYLGYEVDHEAAYAYLQVDNIAAVQRIDLVNSILYDLFTDQTGINHVIAGGNRKSVKLDYPDSQAGFRF